MCVLEHSELIMNISENIYCDGCSDCEYICELLWFVVYSQVNEDAPHWAVVNSNALDLICVLIGGVVVVKYTRGMSRFIPESAERFRKLVNQNPDGRFKIFHSINTCTYRYIVD